MDVKAEARFLFQKGVCMTEERNVPPAPGEFPIGAYQEGYVDGQRNGWYHQDFTIPKEKLGDEEYLRGYRDGYAAGRKHPKPRG